MKGCSYLLGLLVVLGMTTAFADLRSSNASLSNIDNDRAQIHLLLNSVKQAIQQQDLNLLSSFVGPAQSGFEVDVLNPIEQAGLDSLFAAGAGLAPTVATDHRDWYSTAFSFFNFEIDSIFINDASATVLIHADWRRRDLNAPLQDVYTISLFRDGFSWQLSDLLPILAAMRNYLTENQETMKLLAKENGGATKSTWDDYNEWLSNSAVHLLIERDLYPPDFPRFTRTIAENELGGKVFQCTGIPSSYYYENDPLVGRPVTISAISDHCWQRFVVADLANEHDSFIFAKGRYGTGANIDEFAGPGGLEFRVHDLLYICDRGNDRIKVIRIQPTDHQPILEYIRTGFNEPTDLDVTWSGQVIVAEHGDNEIFCFCDPTGCTQRSLTYMNSTLGYIDRPVAVVFGRNPTTSEKTINSAYFIDKDGTRLVKVNYPFSSTPTFGPSFISPDPVTIMTDVSVDNRGQVWVVDSEKGKVYKFTAGLQLLAIHGGEGDGLGEYLYPYGLSFTQAYRYLGYPLTSVPLASMAEAILTEKWSSTTGVRRVVSGVDIQNFTAAYRPKLQSGEGDVFLGEVFVTDLCDWSLEFFCNSARHDSIGQVGQPAGLFTYYRPLPISAPSGLYELRLTVKSINTNGNTIVESRQVQADRTIINQQPTISNIWFPTGDSCVLLNQPVTISVAATDPDGSIQYYDWYTDPDGIGYFDNYNGASVNFVLTTPLSERGLPNFIKARVTDNYGQESSARQLVLDPIVRTHEFYCICTWQPGDFNWSHGINISDAIQLNSYIFGGLPPRPVVMAGDADGNHAVNISDVVFLINYIFDGGPPPPLTCNAY